MTLTNKTWLKHQVTRLFLCGESQEKIAIQLNISVGTVNNLVNEIMKSDDTIELQRQIAIISEKNRVDIRQIAANLRFKNQIKSQGLDERKTEKFLDIIDNLFNRSNVSPSAAANHFYSIIETMLMENIEANKIGRRNKF